MKDKIITLEHIIKDKKGSIVDVRAHNEFVCGSVVGAVNIPLNELPDRLDDLRDMPTPIIFCCSSGLRSSQAQGFAVAQGIACLNGGSWLDVNYYLSLESLN